MPRRGGNRNYKNTNIIGEVVRVSRYGVIVKDNTGKEIGWLNYTKRADVKKFSSDDVGKTVIIATDADGFITSWNPLSAGSDKAQEIDDFDAFISGDTETDDNIVDDPPPLPEEDEESFEETINEKTEVENKPNNSKKDLCSKKLEIAYKLMELYINNAAPRYDIEEFLEIFKKILKAF